MKSLNLFILTLSLLSGGHTIAQASGDCKAIGPKQAPVKQFTNYAPRMGGINGRCGTSASGNDACSYFLEDVLARKRPFAFGAVPQKKGKNGSRGTMDLYGGIYHAPGLARNLGVDGCFPVAAGDRYASSSNGKFKMDIVTRDPRTKLTQRVNASQSEMIPIGRMAGVKSNRKFNRSLASKVKSQNFNFFRDVLHLYVAGYSKNK